MSIQERLASALNRKDQEPNKQLAREIAEKEDAKKLQELVDFFETQPHKELQKDCALTMAWVSEIRPEMIVPYIPYLIGKLTDPINRVIWGSMIALSGLAKLAQDQLYTALPKIIDAMDAGTVVTRDNGYKIMITLYQNARYREDVFLLLLEQLRRAPSNQLGRYTEDLMAVMNSHHKQQLINALEERFEDITNVHHEKRLKKNLKRLYKL